MSPLLALVPFQALLSFFFHVCGGWEVVLPPSTFTPAPPNPFPFLCLLYGGEGKGETSGQG